MKPRPAGEGTGRRGGRGRAGLEGRTRPSAASTDRARPWIAKAIKTWVAARDGEGAEEDTRHSSRGVLANCGSADQPLLHGLPQRVGQEAHGLPTSPRVE